MYEFNYSRPSSIDDAVQQAQESDESKFIAGGQTLLPTMKHRLASPEQIIDLAAIAELQGVTVTADSVTVGAMTTHAEVAASQAIKEAIPALAALAAEIGDPAVRLAIGVAVEDRAPAEMEVRLPRIAERPLTAIRLPSAADDPLVRRFVRTIIR